VACSEPHRLSKQLGWQAIPAPTAGVNYRRELRQVLTAGAEATDTVSG
jgi:hypothetical protein